MYLTSIDRLSKYATAHYLQDRTWVSLTEGIKKRIQYLGKPGKITADNELDTTCVREFLKGNNIDFHFTTTYLKTGNSDVERLHSTLNEHIRLFNADPNNNDDLNEKIFKAITYYNDTIHSTTNTKPINFINNLITKEELFELTKIWDAEKKKRITELNNNTKDVTNFENDLVKNYRVSKAQPKYKKITKFRKDGNYLVSDENKFKRVYKNQVRRKYKYQN